MAVNIWHSKLYWQKELPWSPCSQCSCDSWNLCLKKSGLNVYLSFLIESFNGYQFRDKEEYLKISILIIYVQVLRIKHLFWTSDVFLPRSSHISLSPRTEIRICFGRQKWSYSDVSSVQLIKYLLILVFVIIFRLLLYILSLQEKFPFYYIWIWGPHSGNYEADQRLWTIQYTTRIAKTLSDFDEKGKK